MAYLDDDSKQQQGLSAVLPPAGAPGPTPVTGGATGGAAGPGQPAAPPSGQGVQQQAAAQGQGTGYNNWQTTLGLNQGSAQAMGDKVAGGLNQSADAYRAGLGAQEPGTEMNAANSYAGQKMSDQARAAGSFSGLQGVLGQQYGNGQQYTAGQSGMDAFLTQQGKSGGKVAAASASNANLNNILGAPTAAPAPVGGEHVGPVDSGYGVRTGPHPYQRPDQSVRDDQREEARRNRRQSGGGTQQEQ